MENKWLTYSLLVVLGLLAGFVIGHTIGSRSVTTTTQTQQATSTVATDTVQQTGLQNTNTTTYVPSSLINVKDQKAGDTVFVSRVALQQPGWVAIREMSDGKEGNILGAQWFDAGTHQGTVSLLRGTVAGQTYYATLWRDNNDHTFDQNTDTELTNVSMTFSAY